MMAPSLLDRARRYLADARAAAGRAPVEVAVAVVVALAFSWAVESEAEAMRAWAEVAIAATLIFCTAWSLTLLYGLGAIDRRTRWAATLAGAVVAGVYGSTVLDLTRGSEAWRAAAVLAASALLVVAAPAYGTAAAERTPRLRRVGGLMALRLAGVGLYALTLYAGLALAIAAVDSLFELELGGSLYAHVFGWLMLVLVPVVFVGGLPDYVQPPAAQNALAATVHRISGFLVPPLLALYLAILFAYVARIAVTGEMPRNLVSPMVLAAGLLAALALLLFDPQPEPGRRFRWLRFTPLLFIPLGLLGVHAVRLRIVQYGWTEVRGLRVLVLVVLLGLAVGAVVQQLRRRRFPLHAAPAVLAACLLLAVVGPWNVLAGARTSQQARLQAALREAGIAPEHEAPAADRTVSDAAYEDIRSTAAYLARGFGADALPPVMRDSARAGQVWDLARTVGLQRDPTTRDGPRHAATRLNAGTEVPLDADGTVAVRIGLAAAMRAAPPGARPPTAPSAPERPGDGIVSTDGTVLRIRLDDVRLRADMAPLQARLAGRVDDRAPLEADHATLDVFDEAGARRGRLLILEYAGQWQAGAFVLRQLDAILLLERVAPPPAQPSR